MTEGPAPVGRSVGGPHDGTAPAGDDAARRAQFLATEHWSLLATRSMSWNEAFSRTGMFLSTLSAATVALALAGPAMAFGATFAIFALVVLSVTLFLGIATYVRLVQVNNEDLFWVYGMNRLRASYTRIAPGIEHDFVSGYTVDAEGFARTFGAIDVTTNISPLHMLVTTPAVVGVISSAVAGVIAGLVAHELAGSELVAVGTGIVAFVIAVAVSIAYGRREAGKYIARILGENSPDA
jgi:hypothetical protein